MMQTKEQLLYYMLGGHIHLSKKDYGFFKNLQHLIHDNKKITSNQVKLFDKLLLKYQRQLKKNNLDIDHLIKLLWNVEVVETLPEYLDAKISIVENIIQVRLPFNNKFIQYFRKLYLNPFVWNKKIKAYEAEYSTHAFKTAFHSVSKFYNDVKCCQVSDQLLSDLECYKKVKYWTPTLVKSGNTFYIAAINEHLHDCLKDISLNDDPITLFKLSGYAIKTDESILGDDKFKKFAANYLTEIDLEEIDIMAEWLKFLKVDQVFTARDIIYNKTISSEVKTALNNNELILKSYTTNIDDNCVNVMIKNTTHSYMNIKNIEKIIHITNSRTINVK